MPTTTNNGWDIPADTDLVKNGALAIRTLGQDIDTTLGVYAQSGLVKLNTTTFSAVASQSISDVFSTTYTNYRVLVNLDTNSAGALVQMRMRVSGADNSTTNYAHVSYRNRMGSTSFAAYTKTADGNTLFYLINEAQTETATVSFDLFNPFASEYTQLHGIGTNNQDTFGFAGSFNATTSFTGFTLLVGAGTMTGSVSVYGYNK